MKTIKHVFMEQIEEPVIQAAAEILRSGGLVAFPTETVYGLGADALNADAVRGIFKAKGRPQDNPLIIHVAGPDVQEYVTEVPAKALELMRRFWPGPLTLILRKSPRIPLVTSAGLDTVGIRMPNNPVALRLIEALGRPIAAPSANLSGRPSPTTFARCVEDLDGRVDMILGHGRSAVGLESTIVDYSVHPPRVLRPGYVTYEALRAVDGDILYQEAFTQVEAEEGPKAPGMKYRHYAPTSPLFLILGERDRVVAKMQGLIEEQLRLGKTVGVLAPFERKEKYRYNEKGVVFISMGSEKHPDEAARNLFETLRSFDDLKVDLILSEGVQDTGIGTAVMNRLKKASGYNIIEV